MSEDIAWIPLPEPSEEAKQFWQQIEDLSKRIEVEICRVYQIPEWMLSSKRCVALDRPRPRELVLCPPDQWRYSYLNMSDFVKQTLRIMLNRRCGLCFTTSF